MKLSTKEIKNTLISMGYEGDCKRISKSKNTNKEIVRIFQIKDSLISVISDITDEVIIKIGESEIIRKPLTYTIIRKWECEYGEDFWIDGPIGFEDDVRIAKLAFKNISLESKDFVQDYIQNNSIDNIGYVETLMTTFDDYFDIFRDGLQETKEFKFLVKHLIRAFNELEIDWEVYFEDEE